MRTLRETDHQLAAAIASSERVIDLNAELFSKPLEFQLGLPA